LPHLFLFLFLFLNIICSLGVEQKRVNTIESHRYNQFDMASQQFHGEDILDFHSNQDTKGLIDDLEDFDALSDENEVELLHESEFGHYQQDDQDDAVGHLATTTPRDYPITTEAPDRFVHD
jgi:hypothetical protein